jgi:hypothetical protein
MADGVAVCQARTILLEEGMSKTSRKSLPTLLLALCLLIGQAALLARPSATHAASGPFITVLFEGSSTTYTSSNSFGTLEVTGGGFVAGSPVWVTFNAPYGADNGPADTPTTRRATPPNEYQVGDNQSPLPNPNSVTNELTTPPVFAGSFPNTVQVVGTADPTGLLWNQGHNNQYVNLPIPTGTVDGTYAIVAVDNDGNYASTFFTVRHGDPISQPLTAQSVYSADANNSVSIEGLVNLSAPAGTFQNADHVNFYLEDFFNWADNATYNSSGSTTVPLNYNPLYDNPNYTGGPVPTGTLESPLQLQIIACGTAVTHVHSIAGLPIYCQAGADGSLQAVVQVQGVATVDDNIVSYPNHVDSLLYYDQVLSIVARDTTSSSVDYAKAIAAGVHLDHGQTSIALSTNQQTLGGAVLVNGTGFGAYDPVNLYYVTLAPTNLILSPFFSTPVPLGTANTDGSGHFLFTGALNAVPTPYSSLGGGLSGLPYSTTQYPGYILAEDFSTAWGPTSATGEGGFTGDTGAIGIRLNEAATAGFTVTNTGAQSSPLSLTGQSAAAASGTVTGNNITVAVNSTVTVSAQGYQPGESVSFTLTGAGTTINLLPYNGHIYTPGSISFPSGQCQAWPAGYATANASGVATFTFTVPENCNTVTVTSNGTINGGSTVTVTGLGGSSGTSDTGTLVIPPTTAQITPATPYLGTQGGTGIPVTLSGSGFAANEPVVFQFFTVDPFLGAAFSGTSIAPTGTPAATFSGVSDASGNVVLTAQTLSNSIIPTGLTGGLYYLWAQGLGSHFTTTTNVGLPFVAVEGNLNCPTSVLPGQPLVLSGANFADSSPVLITLSNNLSTVQSLTTPLAAPVFSALVMSNALGNTFTYTNTLSQVLAPGTYTLTVSGLVVNPTGGTYSQQLRQCVITVGTTAPAVIDSPTTGPIGTVTTVTGTGFGVNEPIQLSLQYIDPTGALTGTDVPGTAQVVSTTTTTGAFTSTYTIGSNVNALIAGQYYLTAKGLQTGAIARTPFTVTGSTQTPNPTNLFFAEGFTGTVAGGSNADFVETLSILNANNYTTTYTVTYYIQSSVPNAQSTVKSFGGTIAANSVVERSVNTDVGANLAVATSITSPAPISADRIINRSNAGKALASDSSLGQLLNLSSAAPTGGFNYYYASGDATLTNQEYLTMLNPTSSVATVTVNILPQAPASATSVPVIAPITVVIQPLSRTTLDVRHAVIAAGGGITQYGAMLNSNVPIASERVEYFGDGIGSGKYGAISSPAGTSQYREQVFAADSGVFPSTGGNSAAGTGNDSSQIDIVNPNPASAGSATVTVSAFSNTGAPINSQQVQVDGGTRETVNVNDIVGTQADVFSVIATSDQNVYVEKATFYGGNPSAGGTFAAVGAVGSPAGLTSVAFPYLDLTSPSGTVISQTVYLYNPGATAISVLGTFVSQAGTTSAHTYSVAPNSVTAVNVNADASTLAAGPLGGVFQVVNVGGTAGNTGASFVASVVSSSAGFANVTGTQGTYPIGAAQGS